MQHYQHYSRRNTVICRSHTGIWMSSEFDALCIVTGNISCGMGLQLREQTVLLKSLLSNSLLTHRLRRMMIWICCVLALSVAAGTVHVGQLCRDPKRVIECHSIEDPNLASLSGFPAYVVPTLSVQQFKTLYLIYEGEPFLVAFIPSANSKPKLNLGDLQRFPRQGINFSVIHVDLGKFGLVVKYGGTPTASTHDSYFLLWGDIGLELFSGATIRQLNMVPWSKGIRPWVADARTVRELFFAIGKSSKTGSLTFNDNGARARLIDKMMNSEIGDQVETRSHDSIPSKTSHLDKAPVKIKPSPYPSIELKMESAITRAPTSLPTITPSQTPPPKLQTYNPHIRLICLLIICIVLLCLLAVTACCGNECRCSCA